MLTEKELISKLQGLKQIKPRHTWVSSVKMNIFNSAQKEAAKPTYRVTFSNIVGFINQRKLVYTLASFLLIFAGVVGFLKYSLPQNVDIAKHSTASILAQNTLKDRIEEFKVKSQTFSQLTKDASPKEDVSSALKEVEDATKSLTDTIQQNPTLAKTVAMDVNNNKSLLDVPGSDGLKSTSNDLYKTIDEQMIKDLEATTLTLPQKDELDRIKDSFDKGDDYATVLKDILFLSASTTPAVTTTPTPTSTPTPTVTPTVTPIIE